MLQIICIIVRNEVDAENVRLNTISQPMLLTRVEIVDLDEERMSYLHGKVWYR